MTEQQALRMLEVPDGADITIIKKCYRRLISEVHPDSGRETDCRYTAQEINEAYDYLVRVRVSHSVENSFRGSSQDGSAENSSRGSSWNGSSENSFHRKGGSASSGNDARREQNYNRGRRWSAPVCDHAWCERDILENMTDEDGEVVGTFTAARGRYLYTPEEEFSLFLKSLYRCSAEILEQEDVRRVRGCPPETRMHYQAELLYLLAAQFIDPVALLEQRAEVLIPEDGRKQYVVSAMLEQGEGERRRLSEGAVLFPEGVRNHRLYLMDEKRSRRGYLSFPDDRMYYCLIPLFEQKRLQVKIRAGEIVAYGRKKCRKLELTVRFTEDGPVLPENINLRIRQLLEAYILT